MKVCFNNQHLSEIKLSKDYNDGGYYDKGKIFTDTVTPKFDLDNSTDLAKYLFIPECFINLDAHINYFVRAISKEPVLVYAGDKCSEYSYDGNTLHYHVVIDKNIKNYEAAIKHVSLSSAFYKTHYVTGEYPNDKTVVVIRSIAHNRFKKFLNKELDDLFPEDGYRRLFHSPDLMKSYNDYDAITNSIIPNRYGAHLLGLAYDYSEADRLIEQFGITDKTTQDVLYKRHGEPCKLQFLND